MPMVLSVQKLEPALDVQSLESRIQNVCLKSLSAPRASI